MNEAISVANAKPAPGSGTGLPTPKGGPSASPVNASSAASNANQQAIAAGETKGLTPQDQAAQPQAQPFAPPVAPVEAPTLDAPVSFRPSGNPVIDQIGDLLYDKKVPNADGIIDEAISTQQLSLASKASLIDALGDSTAKLIINSLETSVQQVKEAGEAEGKRLKDYAFSKFGGADPETTWSGLQQFAKSDPSIQENERRSMNEMLSEGGFKAEMVIDTLLNKYQQSSGYSAPPALIQGDGGATNSFAYLSKQEYQAQIGPAVHKHGENSQEVQALRQRRSISMSRGYN